MKKFIFCTALVMLFTSCMKNDVEVDAVQRTEDFTATFDDGTRADLDGTAVVWNGDDHLTIFTKTSHNRQYKVKDLSANGRSATFEYVGYTGADKTAIINNYAVYPYDAEATILGDVITTTLASEQIYNAERDLTYALMSAKSSTNNFSFVNSGALLRFNVSTILPDTFDLNYIKVSSQSHNIAGEVTIDTNNHLAVVTNNGTNEITLAEINETIDSDVRSFYIAMPAMSFEKSDLSVTFSFADGDKTFALPAFDLEQGKIKSIDYTIKDADEFTGSTPGEDEPAAAKPANNEIWFKLDPTIVDDFTEVVSIWLENLCKNYEIDIETGECILAFDSDVDYLPVLGYLWYDICYDLSGYSAPCPVISITLPECVTAIGDAALASCVLLSEINIPDSVTTIGDCAFCNCSSLSKFNGKYASEDGRCLIVDGVLNSFAPAGLTEYIIPDSVTTIGDYAFEYCSSLTSVTIPDSVTTIGEDAFGWCESLTSVTIPDSVTTIGNGVFWNCSSLTNVTIPDGVTTIGDSAFSSCSSLISVTIPDSVTTIGYCAFVSCRSLTSVTIPDSVTTIGEYAFQNCISLTSITIPDSVKTIGAGAFCNCRSLTSITIPDSVTTIGKYAFEYCSSLTSVTIPDGVTSIDSSTFSGCSSLTSITIPDSVTSMGYSAFNGCSSLTSVTIPDSVTTIGDWAFYNCSSLTSVYITDLSAWCRISFKSTVANPLCCAENLYLNNELVKDLVLPSDITEIKSYAFSGCNSLTSITIPDSVTTIGQDAFAYCNSLTSATIGDSVTAIGDYAFWACTSLTRVTIPDSVTSIGDWAFAVCSSLTGVYCKAVTPPAGGSDMFYDNAYGRKIYVPTESVEAYKSASYWSNYKSSIVGYEF